MAEPKSPCPMLNALFLSGRLEPDANGTVTLAELGEAMMGVGVPEAEIGVLRLMAAFGSGGAAALLASSLGAVDDHRVDLGFHLLKGALGHAADSGVLGDPPGIKEDRFAALVAFAEERVGADGVKRKVMTREAYLAAFDQRIEGERARQGSAFKGSMLASLEAQLIPAVFGELTVEQLRAFYFEGVIPPKAADHATLAKLLPQVLARLPEGARMDFARRFRSS